MVGGLLLFSPLLANAQVATSTNPNAPLIASLESILKTLEAEIQQILIQQSQVATQIASSTQQQQSITQQQAQVAQQQSNVNQQQAQLFGSIPTPQPAQTPVSVIPSCTPAPSFSLSTSSEEIGTNIEPIGIGLSTTTIQTDEEIDYVYNTGCPINSTDLVAISISGQHVEVPWDNDGQLIGHGQIVGQIYPYSYQKSETILQADGFASKALVLNPTIPAIYNGVIGIPSIIPGTGTLTFSTGSYSTTTQF